MKKIISMAILIMACAVLLPACSEIDTSSSSINSKAKANSSVPIQSSAASSTKFQKPSEAPDSHSKNAGKVVYANKLLSFSFISVQDMPNMDGMFLLNVKVQNKSNKKISVYPKDASVNNHMIQLTSGTPCDIMPGKSAIHSFSGVNSTVEISKASEIKNIKLKLWITDESTTTLETTKEIEINS
ncbi:MAG TPA: hypothetical protein DG942_01830 [Ruminococcaceae bacterium]|jgi:hypothetical protein|nr:hypothetical protein [Oscillospiraceae bacterium]